MNLCKNNDLPLDTIKHGRMLWKLLYANGGYLSYLYMQAILAALLSNVRVQADYYGHAGAPVRY